MQLYALDINGFSCGVERAEKSRNYHCPECNGIVRVREGARMKRHFYHLRTTWQCRQSGKGQRHLQAQYHLLASLPPGEAVMELRFPTLGRIADVAWELKKIVFEIQCASMSPQEAMQRTFDYRSIGWEVIWILHDDRYHGRRTTPLEDALQDVPHYFTNIDEEGNGYCYDQIMGLMHRKIQFEVIPATSQRQSHSLPSIIWRRMAAWPIHLQGDYLSAIEDSVLWEPFVEVERRLQMTVLLRSIAHRFIVRPYRILFQWILEYYCVR